MANTGSQAKTSKNIDVDSQNVISFTVGVGDTIRLCPPAYYLPVTFPDDSDSYDPRYYLNGFIVLDQSLGEFSEVPGSNMCVYYTHTKSGRQIIQYCSDSLGKKSFYAVLEGIRVHKHDSISQGGPAFATYWSGLAANKEE